MFKILLMRLNRVNGGKERFLDELEQSVREFESKIPFSSLEKYILKPVLNDIKPIIEKFQVFQGIRENGILPGEEVN